MKHEHNVRISARTAELTADDEDDGEWRFGGVAVGENEILHTDDGTPVIFTPEVLAEAAATQAGEPLSKDHPEDDDGQPVYPPPVDETVGKVPKAGHVPGKGLVYEAAPHDEAIANGVKAGNLEVSVHPTFDLGEKDPETGAYIPENVEFLDLSVVSKGMAASNTAEWGPNHALASWTREADIGAELDDVTAGEGVPETEQEAIGWFRRLAEKAGITAADGESPSNESAESDAADNQQNMNDDTREQYVEFITANGDFDAESLEAMDDDTLETTHELVATAAADDGGEDDEPGEETDDGDEETLADMTVDELGSALREQGFVTEDNAGTLIDEATAQKDKAEKVDEIIAESDDYAEDDRDDLMASADSLIENEHARATSASGVSLPGATGTHSRVTADADTDDLDEFGTGVQE